MIEVCRTKFKEMKENESKVIVRIQADKSKKYATSTKIPKANGITPKQSNLRTSRSSRTPQSKNIFFRLKMSDILKNFFLQINQHFEHIY